MKEYKLVYLNTGLNLSRNQYLERAEETINSYVAKGWELQQTATLNDSSGAMYGVFYREKN